MPNHDAAMRIGGEAPGSGPNLYCGAGSIGTGGAPLPRIVIGGPSPAADERRNCDCLSPYRAGLCRRAQDHAQRHLASGNEPPQRDQQFASERDHHGLTFLAAGGDACLIPLCQGAVLLVDQEAPGELDHAATYSCVARFGEALFLVDADHSRRVSP
jgi:hypothetical protein